MIYLVIFFTSLILTIFFTPYLIEYSIKHSIVDYPEEGRRINKEIIPRMGGLIIYLIVLSSLITFYGDLNNLRFFLMASAIIFLTGMLDDIVGIKWNHKFLVQSAMAFFLAYFVLGYSESIEIFGVALPEPFGFLILALLIVGVINAINLYDGMDGLVSGFSLLVAFVIFLIGLNRDDKFLIIMSSSLMGSLIGFLKFNAYPARIFLGDTGSYSLGFFIIAGAVLSATDSATKVCDLTFPVILLGVPIIDTIKVMIVRLAGKRNPFLPDTSHIHHLIYARQIKHKITVFILQALNLVFAAVALYYLSTSKVTGIVLFLVIVMPLLFINKVLDIIKASRLPAVFRRVYHRVPELIFSLFIKYLIPIISLASFLVLVGLAPVKSEISSAVIILSIIFISMLLFYSFVNYHRNKYFNDIFVFFNLILFLFYSNYSEKIYSAVSGIPVHSGLVDSLVLILLPFIVFFLFFRDRILRKKTVFLTGIDLIILVFIVLLSVSSDLLPTNRFAGINLILFNSFLLYISYKVISSVKVRYQPALFLLSFVIPLLSLITLLVS